MIIWWGVFTYTKYNKVKVKDKDFIDMKIKHSLTFSSKKQGRSHIGERDEEKTL